ncbi:hypothetical protein M409DRAFT_17036 [Zasmidium cellare ATCC 36951]|uniref:Rhodopsin domain-containing protein n=1 Tax=Zasmidium cellare ATCC 36951 TaxID=1080233 RepID=A0A6A6D3Q5_ZASCE|nr:uncharacterized protein M409DRAFT_17036 [Zasmidium cellare ATCC 36951]KAF2173088.1 hypothetical protein M409DRAFT_17036 [Zasmidium cellare ATCC 36951]
MTALKVESWIWYAMVIMVAASRYVSRYMTLRSLRRFQLDDYGMLIVLCFYTTMIATINIVRNTSSNLQRRLPPGFDLATLTPSGKAEREYGSKLVLVVEQCQCVTIWGAKLCLLVLYLRLTQFRWENVGIKVLIGYVIGSFVIMEVLYFAVWCRPFHEYWAVPTNSSQCDAATNHLITNAVFNLSSDCIMLAIGLPMFLRMKLPWKKKLPLVVIFSLGVFVILAAILNKVYSFTQPFGSMWSYWYVRESSTALLVANLPFVWKFWAKITGINSLTGATRQDPTQADSGRGGSDRKESLMNLPGLFSESPPSSQRRGSNTSNGLTLMEMLRGDPPPKAQPELRRYDSNDVLPAMQKVVINDGPARETLRREHSNQERRQSTTPPSSALPPSIQSSWSAGSFV